MSLTTLRHYRFQSLPIVKAFWAPFHASLYLPRSGMGKYSSMRQKFMYLKTSTLLNISFLLSFMKYKHFFQDFSFNFNADLSAIFSKFGTWQKQAKLGGTLFCWFSFESWLQSNYFTQNKILRQESAGQKTVSIKNNMIFR